MLNSDCYIAILETIQLCEGRAQARLRILSTKCVHESYTYIINMYEEDLALNNLQCLICHKTQPNEDIYTFVTFVNNVICCLYSVTT